MGENTWEAITALEVAPVKFIALTLTTVPMTLQANFLGEIEILRKLFSAAEVDKHLAELEDIFSATELLWRQYLPDEVKYILIAEAPPFRSIDPVDGVVYFYNHRAKSRTLLRALSTAFEAPDYETNKKLLYLKEKGFLLIDSLPFAMDYSKRRNNRKYRELVEACNSTYLSNKLNAIRYSRDLKIAFAFRKNAEAVISGCKRQCLPVLGLKVSSAQIAVNSANYPCHRKLREIFQLT